MLTGLNEKQKAVKKENNVFLFSVKGRIGIMSRLFHVPGEDGEKTFK